MVIALRTTGSLNCQTDCEVTIPIGNPDPPTMSCQDMTLNADAGRCQAQVNLQAQAHDPCWGDNVPIDFEIWEQDHWSIIDASVALPTGTNRLRAVAIGSGGQTGTCPFQVDVSPYNELVVDVELGYLHDPHPATGDTLDRCIRLELFDCPESEPAAVLEQVVVFPDRHRPTQPGH